MNFKIVRHDKRNLGILKIQDDGKEINTGFYGNSLISLAHGLLHLVGEEINPNPDQALIEQVEALRTEVQAGLSEILTKLEEIKTNGGL